MEIIINSPQHNDLFKIKFWGEEKIILQKHSPCRTYESIKTIYIENYLRKNKKL